MIAEARVRRLAIDHTRPAHAPTLAAIDVSAKLDHGAAAPVVAAPRDGLLLAALGPQEFQPRRGAIEQVANLDARTGRARGGSRFAARHHLRPRAPQAQSAPATSSAGADGQRSRSTAAPHRESHSSDPDQRVVGSLRGGVTLDAEAEIIGHHADSHRRHRDQATPTILDRHLDMAAPASSAFSTSSLTTEAGRSTTSPAAIRFASSSGRRRIVGTTGSEARIDPLGIADNGDQQRLVEQAAATRRASSSVTASTMLFRRSRKSIPSCQTCIPAKARETWSLLVRRSGNEPVR